MQDCITTDQISEWKMQDFYVHVSVKFVDVINVSYCLEKCVYKHFFVQRLFKENKENVD